MTWVFARVFAYLSSFFSLILDLSIQRLLIFILIYFEWRDTENQQFQIAIYSRRKSHVLCMAFSNSTAFSLSHKTVNTRENFWNVYCFATNQMWHETAKDNGQTPPWISHNLTRNNELVFTPTKNLQFYCFQILKLLFLYFRSFISKEYNHVDMNDMLVTYYEKVMLNQVDRIRQG